jgi:tRNA threonylcarbamoyladenosine biosynthesis protein TsaE
VAGCLVLHSRSPAGTKRIGARIAKLLQPGDVLLLLGDLGSGKTTLTQGIGAGLKVTGQVKSPTFVLMNEYRGRLTVYHADLYRLNDPTEVVDLALDDVAADGVLIVEWPDRAPGELPPEHLLVHIEEESASARRITLTAHGARYETLIGQLQR